MKPDGCETFRWTKQLDNDANKIGNCTSRVVLDPDLTHWGLVTPYGVEDLGQHWFR